MPRKVKASSPTFDDLKLSSGSELGSRELRFAAGEAALGEDEKAFNQLTSRIKSLQARIETAERESLELDRYYFGQFRPALQALGEAMMALAMRLEETAGRRRAGKMVGRQLKRVIPALLQEAFQLVEPTAEALILHEAYARQSHQEVAEVAEKREAEVLPEPCRNPLDADTVRPLRRKTKKALEQEAWERRKNELKQRSQRDVYISLAKVLHPDAEADPRKKHEKEAFLKRVTVAHREGNILDLLQLEMAWLEGGGVRNASADKLALYLELLKEQVKDLEAACSAAESRFRETYAHFPGPIGAFRRALAKEQAQAEVEMNRLVRLTARLEAEPAFLEDCLAVLREDFQPSR